MSKSHTFTGWVSRLAREHTGALVAVARREGLLAEDALDAVQEAFHTFLMLPQARSLVEHDEDARRLLAVVVRNAARNMRRRHHRSAPHCDLEGERELLSEDMNVEELVERAEEHVLLLGCIARLGEVQRCVVTLRVLEEVSAEEVAESLSMTQNHIAVHLYRARKKLTECIESEM